ncbi:MAG: hypothetical protein U0K87_10985, partial [Ruminococcus sp.]|nr:hypothetical protein [Ruminococcus sp.]
LSFRGRFLQIIDLSDILFYYLMELHYSQTRHGFQSKILWFYYLMELHYSQTAVYKHYISGTFYYLMELHYSQT